MALPVPEGRRAEPVSQPDILDDESILDSEILLRRVPNRPSFLTVPNAGTNRIEPTKAAFSLGKGEDGLSVNRESELPDGDTDRANIYDWTNNYGLEFPVAAVRVNGDAGVVSDPVNDVPGGASHALIIRRTADKQRWNDFRYRLIAASRWMPEGSPPQG